MFGPAGGWGIPIAPPTLMITVGGIAMKPRYVDGNLEPRELLDLTISVDHAVVDGATAARFTRRLTDLLERPIDHAEHEDHRSHSRQPETPRS
jgi:pyruvate/2-oxoglutarate dehydrogenase complex dihydrolipoamide acyltransferase (E2) component